MGTRLYTTQLLVPAGTPQSAPVTAAVVLEDATLDSVEIIIPDGHVQLTGIAVLSASAPVVPFALGTFISGNNDRLTFPYAAEVTQNGLTVAGFNNDIYPHTFYLRWQISDRNTSAVTIVSPQAAAPPAPDDLAAITDLTGAFT
jgi:hypothetical protein